MIFVASTLSESPALNMPDLKDYMTTEKAAEALAYHIEHVRELLRASDLEGIKIGQTWLVSIESLNAFKKKTAGYSKHDPRKFKR